jgi:FAD/FMN-containing dehydrogenase
VVEVRFTPDLSHATIGPGVGRRTCYIGLATPLDIDRGELYPVVEDILMRHGGRPHLGKQSFATAADLLTAYGDRFVRFQTVRQEQDPRGKFLNEFTSRLFGPV